MPEAPTYTAEVARLRATLGAGGLAAAADTPGADVPTIVRRILDQVAQAGDEAAARLTSELDRATITPETLRVPRELIAQAHAQADASFLGLIRETIDNLRAYQTHILVKAPPPLVRGGRRLGVRYTPVERVGVYVPGGKALYPSTVLMTVVPAQVAGVPEIVMVSPPTGGEIHPLALALAGELGISEVYRLGGAVGIAALAYGTETIRPVQKLVGPGNAFVAEAKRQLFGRVGIDCIAGPSEVLIVADETAPADFVALDLCAQAEHDPGSAILITPSRELARGVVEALEAEIGQLERGDAIRSALERYGAIIVTPDLERACSLANDFATEHLELITRDDAGCLGKIRNAGAIFLGAHTPVPFGDYYAGPSHVLPTGGTAKFSGPLSANDFLKATSILEYDARSAAEDAPRVAEFARREGLGAHARAAEKRGPSA
jgi:histidinol dehydrogenase